MLELGLSCGAVRVISAPQDFWWVYVGGGGGEYLGIYDEQVQRNIETVKPCLNTGIKATKELALLA